MADQSVTIVLPSGGARTAEVPNDVPVRDLLTELVSLLDLPTVGPDGRPMGYRLDSKALGRELSEDETLVDAGVPDDDRLIITADITAGSVSVGNSPRIRRLRADYELMMELKAQSSLIEFEAKGARKGLPPERYIVKFKCKSIVGVNGKGQPKYSQNHQVEIYLHNEYPHRWPGLKWLTPIWHPNINHVNGSVCIDAAWWTAARSLDRLVIMLGEMLQYKNFHDDPNEPPFPWDMDAAKWCRSYRIQNPNAFPVDNRELLHPERIKFKKTGSKRSAAKARIKLDKPKIKMPRIKLK